MQAIAFVPESDVIDAFLLLNEFVMKKCPDYASILKYFEKTYIGNLKEKSRTIRKLPRFSHSSWNVHNRVLLHLPRTTNSVESWHNSIK